MAIFKKTQIISSIENSDIPLVNYFLGFITFILIVNFLEFFSDPGIVPFSLIPFSNELAIPASVSIAIHIFHTSLWWFAVLLLIPIVFTFITKENITKTLKVMLSFSWLIVFSPLTDLIISKGEGINIHYAYPQKLADFLYILKEFTPGENILVAIVLALAFVYCFIKTKNVIKALLAIILISLGIILAALIPYLMRLLGGVFMIELENITPVLVTRCLIFVVFIEWLIILYLQNKELFKSIAKEMGIFKSLHFILIFMLGILLFRPHIGRFILENLGSLILSFISICLIWALANMLGSLNGQKLLETSQGKAAIGAFLLAASCAISVNFPTFYFIILATAVTIIYLLPPFRFKQYALFSKILLSFNMLILVIMGWLFAGGQIADFPQILTLYFLVFYTLCINFVDIKDYAKDKESGLKTLPVEFGEKRAKILIGFIMLITYLATPWVFLEKMLFYPALVLGLLQFYLINRKNYKEEAVFITHVLGLIGLLIWLNFLRTLG